MLGIGGCVLLLAGGLAAGSALASGHKANASPQTQPKPDPPPPPPPAPRPPPPPPPPPAPPPPPPPAAVVQAPPPPAPVRHKRSRRKHKKAAHRKAAHRKQAVVPSHSTPDASKLPPSPHLAVGGASVETSSGGSSPGNLIIGFGVLLGLLGAGIAYAPRAALPRGAAFKLEPHRQTILVTGAAIGIACILVGVLTGLMGP